MDAKNLLAELSKPFPPEDVQWKPGASKGDKCMALCYADLRAYMDRLDEVMGLDWSCRYMPWGDGSIICELTLYVGGPLGQREAITRSSTGESDAQDEKNNMAGSVSEAMAFKRAAAMFGLGRVFYTLPAAWVAFDAQRKRITEQGIAELNSRYAAWYTKKVGKQAPQPPATGNRASTTPKTPQGASVQAEGDGTPPHQRCFGVGLSVFGPAWNNGGRKWLLEKWSTKATPDNVRDSFGDFGDDEKDALADYMTEHATDLQRIWRKYEADKKQVA